MNAAAALEDLVVLVVASLVPALIFLSWIRTSERFRQASWGTVLRLFAFGAIVATFTAAFLEVVPVDLGTAASQRYPAPEFSFLNGNSTAGAFFLVLVIAPFVEEGLKAIGVMRSGNKLRALPDGPVFGASVGLGFGFFETFVYGLGAFLVGGLAAGLTLILIRSVSSVLLHGSSTAMFGYGYAASRVGGRPGSTGSYYLLAVAMDSSFNVFASLGSIAVALGFSGAIGNYADLLGLLLAFLFAVGAIQHVVSVIHQSDFPSAGGSTSRYRPPAIARRAPPGAVNRRSPPR